MRIRQSGWALVAVLAFAALAACTSPEERAAKYAEAAQQLYDAGDYDKAKIEARNALQIQPKNVKASWVAALVAEKKGETGEMVTYLAVVAEVDPKNAAARVKLGTVLLFSQDYPGAAAMADEALALTPDDPEAHVLKGRVLLQKEDYEGAYAELGRAIELDPKNVQAALIRGLAKATKDPAAGLADLDESIARVGRPNAAALRQARVNVLFSMKRLDAVEEELKSLAADFPDGDYQNRLALLYVSQGKLDEAEGILKQAVAANPKNTGTKVALAQFQSKYMKKPAEAEQTLKGYIAAEPDNLQLQLTLATFYDASERLPEALAIYEQVAAKSPTTVEGLQARNQVASIELRTKQPDKAKAQLDEILKDAPDNVQALLTRGEINYAAGRYQDAISDLRGVLRKEPDSELGLLLLARSHVGIGDRPLATDAYRRLLQANPNQPDALAELPPLLAEAGQAEEAETLLKQALTLDPKNAKALGALVDLLLAKKDLAGAEARAREFAALGLADGSGDRQLGRVLAARQQYAGAFTAYQAALQKNPESTLAFQGAVRALLAEGKADKAAEFIRAHIERYPDHVVARVTLGELLASQGKLEEARGILEDVVTTRPDNVAAYLVLAGSWPQDGAKRIAILERGRKAVPKDPQIGMTLAGEYEQAGRYEDAIRTCEEMLKDDPANVQATNTLASLLVDHGKDAAAHQRGLEAAKVFANSKNPAFLDTLGWAYYVTGDYDAAVRYLELAIAYAERPNPLVRYHLGLAYQASGNPAGAREELGKVLKDTAPGSNGNEQAKAALAKLDAAGK